MAGDPYRATGGSEGHSTRHRETANDAYQLGVELRWRQDQGKPALLRHAVLHAAARHIATVMAMCRHSPPPKELPCAVGWFGRRVRGGAGLLSTPWRGMPSVAGLWARTSALALATRGVQEPAKT